MYNYPFKENNEFVLNERENLLGLFKNNKISVNILLTNKNILLFVDKYMNNEYELFLKISLEKLEYLLDNGNTLFKDIDLLVYDFDIEDFIVN